MQGTGLPTKLTAAQRQQVSKLFGAGNLRSPTVKVRELLPYPAWILFEQYMFMSYLCYPCFKFPELCLQTGMNPPPSKGSPRPPMPAPLPPTTLTPSSTPSPTPAVGANVRHAEILSNALEQNVPTLHTPKHARFIVMLNVLKNIQACCPPYPSCATATIFKMLRI